MFKKKKVNNEEAYKSLRQQQVSSDSNISRSDVSAIKTEVKKKSSKKKGKEKKKGKNKGKWYTLSKK